MGTFNAAPKWIMMPKISVFLLLFFLLRNFFSKIPLELLLLPKFYSFVVF